MTAEPIGRPPAAAGRLGPAQRIRKSAEMRAVLRGSHRVRTPHLVLLLRAREQAGPARLGLVASRKIGNAVARNRMKRLMREAFRATRALWHDGIDLVVIASQPPGRLRAAELAGELLAARRAIEWRTRQALARRTKDDA